jgi:hypothetical protein
MAGLGTGTRGGKSLTTDMWSLDIRKVQRADCLKPGHVFNWQWTRDGEKLASIELRPEARHVTLNYRSRDRGGEWQAMRYAVRLSWTWCNYGGYRAWWICPAVGCGRRVAVLYGGKVYACRHCHRLAFPSTQTGARSRVFDRANKLRLKLGWCAGVANPPGDKPKGMHWKTYVCLQNQLLEHAQMAAQSTNLLVARLRKKLG